MRKRINLSVDGELYRRLSEIQREAGLRNLCELAVTTLRMVVARRDRSRLEHAAIVADEADERVDEMFGELADAEATQWGSVPVRRRRRGYGY